MEQLLVNLLKGPLGGMGVSEADVASYIHLCINHIYAILAVLVVGIVLIIVGIVIKKGLVSVSAVVAMILAILIIANLICFGPMKDTLSTMMNSSVNLTDATMTASREVISRVGDEGLVLVENNGMLPLSSDVTALNVFGWGSTNPIFGGTGSGSSDGSSAVGILQSLQDAGYATNEDLSKIYTDYRTDRPSIAMAAQDWTLPEPTVDVYTDDVMSAAKSFSDTAVIVLSRSGGEGADLPTDMNAVIKGTWNIAGQMTGIDQEGNITQGNGNYGYLNGSYTNNGNYDDFEPGEHYLEPSVTEENMIAKVCENFDKVILVVNANNAMELGWVADYPQIGAVILAPGTGASGMAALGKVIKGDVNPSGKTVDTYLYDLTSAPTFNNIGNFSYSNVNDLREAIVKADASYPGNLAFVNYVEGIYNGYKFYETAAEEGLINYEDEVLYPFGYGLSYTTFEQTIGDFDASGDSIAMTVEVKNTGSVAGKDVVEVYFTPPYTNGGIEKASVNLVDFAKTGVIEAGQSEAISFEIPKEDLASYDDSGEGKYVLEAGDYTISIRSDSHTVLGEVTFTQAAVDYSDGRPSDKSPVHNQFQDYSRGDFVQLSRADGFANYAEATAAPASLEMSAEVRAEVEKHNNAGYNSADYDNPDDVAPTLGAQNGLKLANLTGKAYDDPDWDKLLDQLSFADMVQMINLGGWQTAKIDSVGKVQTADCDGPAGVSNFMTGAYGTAYPTEVLMAQTWNTPLMEEMGTAMGQEYAECNNYGWYGPAMNNHRNAFAGRNFEYFSEDGVLAGKMASAEINGAGSKGLYPYIKHFVLNDQESNRCSILMTWASEQAIREIYLKPFEIAVKNYTGSALACMSSFNFIGTKWSGGNSNLLNNVLRGEWGFVGLVETDYNGSYGYMNSDMAVRNGNDLMLGFGSADSNQFKNQSATCMNAMRQSCKNILYTVANSGYYANGDPTGGMDNMTRTFVGIDVGVGVVLVALEAIAIFLFLKKRKAD